MECARGHLSSLGLIVTLLSALVRWHHSPSGSSERLMRSSRVRGATQHPAHPSEEAGPPELWRCREAGLASFDRLLHVAG